MKKSFFHFFCMLLIAIMLPGLLPVKYQAIAAKESIVLGDVDMDGKITASDARLALRRAVDLEQFLIGSDQYLACDVNRDGKVAADDARSILRAAVGLEILSGEDVFDFDNNYRNVVNPSEYALYTKVFTEPNNWEYNGTEMTKTGIFAILQDEWSGKTRFYVWGYGCEEHDCDYQWEFVPRNVYSLPEPGSYIQVKGTLTYTDDQQSGALDHYWLTNTSLTVLENHASSPYDYDLTTMSPTIARVQMFSIQNYPEFFVGKTLRVYGRVLSKNILQHPYFDNSWELQFYTSNERTPNIGQFLVLGGTVTDGDGGVWLNVFSYRTYTEDPTEPFYNDLHEIVDPADYQQWVELFSDIDASREKYEGHEMIKTGIFTILQDEWTGKTRYYVWGYGCDTHDCDYQWEFVPNNTASLPEPGSYIQIKGKLTYTENQFSGALDHFWFTNTSVYILENHESSNYDYDLTTMSPTLTRVQLFSIQNYTEHFAGKTMRIFGRALSGTELQHPYYDDSWVLDAYSVDFRKEMTPGQYLVLGGVITENDNGVYLYYYSNQPV